MRSIDHELTWRGKEFCAPSASSPANSVMLTDPSESANGAFSENVFIEGDNLEALKLLRAQREGFVRCIYIDPPYNTGATRLYRDAYPEADWLSLMYPRLLVARDLLREDGVIFVSIDDFEVHRLRMLLDEAFGASNFVATIIWERRVGRNNATPFFSRNHEYILVYAKDKKQWRPNREPRDAGYDAVHFKNRDNDPRGPWHGHSIVAPRFSHRQQYEITLPSGRVVTPPKNKSWAYTEENFSDLLSDGRIWFGENGDAMPAKKLFQSELVDGLVPTTLWLYHDVVEAPDPWLRKLLSDAGFSYAKPVSLIRKVLQLATLPDRGDVVLDFFGGSGTTAQAVLEANAEDGGNRTFVLIQKEEKIAKKGIRTIAQLARLRIKSCISTIRAQWFHNGDLANPRDLDLGFQAFKVARASRTFDRLQIPPPRANAAAQLGGAS